MELGGLVLWDVAEGAWGTGRVLPPVCARENAHLSECVHVHMCVCACTRDCEVNAHQRVHACMCIHVHTCAYV